MQVAASHGFFVNHNALLLKLCGPFIDGNSQVFWNKVDWKYVVMGDRLDFKEVRLGDGAKAGLGCACAAGDGVLDNYV